MDNHLCFEFLKFGCFDGGLMVAFMGIPHQSPYSSSDMQGSSPRSSHASNHWPDSSPIPRGVRKEHGPWSFAASTSRADHKWRPSWPTWSGSNDDSKLHPSIWWNHHPNCHHFSQSTFPPGLCSRCEGGRDWNGSQSERPHFALPQPPATGKALLWAGNEISGSSASGCHSHPGFVGLQQKHPRSEAKSPSSSLKMAIIYLKGEFINI